MSFIRTAGIAFIAGMGALFFIGRATPKGPEPEELNCKNGDLCDDTKDRPQAETKYESVTVQSEPMLGEAINCLYKPVPKERGTNTPEELKAYEEYGAYKATYDAFCVKDNKEVGEEYRKALKAYLLSKYRYSIIEQAKKDSLDSVTSELRKKALDQIGPKSLSSLTQYTPNEGLDWFFNENCRNQWYSVNPCCPEPEGEDKQDGNAVKTHEDCKKYAPNKILFDLVQSIKADIVKEIGENPLAIDPKIDTKDRLTTIVTKTKDLTFRTTYAGKGAPKGTVLLIRGLDRPPAWDKGVRDTLASKVRVIEIAIPRTGDGANILPGRLAKTIMKHLMSEKLNNDPIYDGPKASESTKYLNAPVEKSFQIVVEEDSQIEINGRKIPGYGRVLASRICLEARAKNVSCIGTFLSSKTRPNLALYLEKIGQIEIEEAGLTKLINNTAGWWLGLGYKAAFSHIGYQSNVKRSFITPIAKAMWTGEDYPTDLAISEVQVDAGKPNYLLAKLLKNF